MLSGLLITLNILVCIALIGVVLLQRSEGGALGTGGGPTGLITTRGAGDLLTRTTWILFALFLVLSLSLTLLGAHDRATNSVLDKLKLQQINPNAAAQTNTVPAPGGAPVPPLTGAVNPLMAAPTAPMAAPPPVSAPPAAPAATKTPVTAAKPPAAASAKVKTIAAPAAAAPTEAPAPAPAPPVLQAPPPQPVPAAPEKSSSDTPAAAGAP